MGVKGAGGRAMSGGGTRKVKDGGAGSSPSEKNMKTSPSTARMRRETDSGRESEKHLADHMASVSRGGLNRQDWP
jgi:hypothetical protein